MYACSMDGCTATVKARGLCSAHYQARRKAGTLPDNWTRRTNAKSDTQKFLDHVDKRGPDECWEWIGARNHLGYGLVGHRTGDKVKTTHAHRFVYRLFNGSIPAGKHVLHTCDNRACVNPAHLWVGTHADNMQDMKEKGRRKTARLSTDDIEDIKSRFSNGEMQILIADHYGISQSMVSNIVRGLRYA